MNDLERLARDLAYWHGQKLAVHDDEGSKTIAKLRGCTSEEYSERHWREYDTAAQYVMEMLLLERKRGSEHGQESKS